MADALSRNSSGSITHISVKIRPLIQKIHKLVDQGLRMKKTKSGGLIAQFRVKLILRDRIKVAQSRDLELLELIEKVHIGKFTNFNLDDEGLL